jgi:predicted dehydrogenase
LRSATRLGSRRNRGYAEANWGRVERWHPSPESLYEVGPLVDVGIYPLTILTAMFGPARLVTAFGTLFPGALDERGRNAR